jgi:hypothetical protein
LTRINSAGTISVENLCNASTKSVVCLPATGRNVLTLFEQDIDDVRQEHTSIQSPPSKKLAYARCRALRQITRVVIFASKVCNIAQARSAVI